MTNLITDENLLESSSLTKTSFGDAENKTSF